MVFIDANNYIKRIYHGGQDPYELFLTLIQNYGGEAVEMVCDSSKSRDARRKIYPKYKDRGVKSDDAVFFGIYDNIIKIARHFSNVKAIEVNSGEADDYIMDNAKAGDTVISNDKDLWPLLSKKVRILIAGTTKVDEQLIETKFHHPDPQLIQVHKALVGDSSDKITGKRGFGAAAFAKLTRADLYLIREILMGVERDDVDPAIKALAADENVKLSWKLVRPFPYLYTVFTKIDTPLQDFLDETGINLLENM